MSSSLDKVHDETKQKWDRRISFLRENVHLLYDWEDNLIASFQEQRYFGKILSPRQVKYLYQIYNRIDQKLG